MTFELVMMVSIAGVATAGHGYPDHRSHLPSYGGPPQFFFR